MKRSLGLLLIAGLMAGPLVRAQQVHLQMVHAQQNDRAAGESSLLENGAILYLELAKSVDAKKARPGDEISAFLLADVVSHGKVVLRHDARLLGHVTEAQAHTRDNPESRLGIVFDRIAVKGAPERAFQSVLLAMRPAPRLMMDSMSAPAPPGTMAPPTEWHYPMPKGPAVPTPTSREQGNRPPVPASSSNKDQDNKPDAPASTNKDSDKNDRERIRRGGNDREFMPTDIEDLSLTASDNGVNRVVVSFKRTVKLESGIRLELRIVGDGAPTKSDGAPPKAQVHVP